MVKPIDQMRRKYHRGLLEREALDPDPIVQFGRWFDEGEVQGKRRVAVLGHNVPESLGTPANVLVGRSIQIRGISFEVIGVLEEKGGAAWMQPDQQAVLQISRQSARHAASVMNQWTAAGPSHCVRSCHTGFARPPGPGIPLRG